MAAKTGSAQSDDCYSRISFIARDGSETEGTLGWRDGAENRVQFQVWDGPSFAAQGDDLAAAFAAARAGIVRAGFTPLAPDDGSLAEFFINSAPVRRIQPRLWLLVAAILIALLIPAIARAAVPEYGARIPFPNADYDWRYEGPNYDARDSSKNSAPRMRHKAREGGDPDWLNIPLDPVIAILKRGSGQVLARYRFEGGQFCDYEDDNCELDGLFPLVLSTAPQEPVLVVVRHVGAHGRRISILQPLVNKQAPVFEATADFALGLRLRRDGVDVTVDRALAGGEARQEHLHWPAAAARQAELPEINLPEPPLPSASAAAFEARLRALAAARDLDGFMALLADDVLVSFGANGGKAEFAEHWQLSTEAGRAVFWVALDNLLTQCGWNEAGGKDDDGADYPQRMTWPWFFAAWPHDVDAENVFIANEDAPLRAAPLDTAPVLARLPAGTVLHGSMDTGDEWPEWVGHGWLEVVAPGDALGVVRQEDVTPLLETRMIAVETKTGWQIEAMVAGD